MPHAINYRLTETALGEAACEVHVNGRLAVVLLTENGKYRILPDPHFNDASVTAEDLQKAIEGAAAKLDQT